MSRFNDFHATVAEFMKDFGFRTTYFSVGEAIPDDTNGTISAVTTEIEIEAIRLDLPRPTNGITSNAGSQIQEGDQLLYVRPTEKADKFADAVISNPTKDYVLINNARWKVVTVKRYAPDAEDNILYELYIRN